MPAAGHGPDHQVISAVLGLLSAIAGTQWIEYQKRQELVSAQSGTPAWLRRLLFSGVLLLTFSGAGAQTNWTARPQTGSNQISDVAYGAGIYVAVGADDGLIEATANGFSWVNVVAGTTSANGLSAIIYAGGKFVTVGNNGRILTSTNGTAWTSQVSGTTALLKSIAYGGGQFVAVGINSTILTSANGVTWTSQVAGPPGPALYLNDVTYSGGQFIVVGSGGTVKTSPTGVTWTDKTSGTAMELYGVTAGNGKFVAVGVNSTVVTSPDGVTWTPQTVAGPATFLIKVACNTTTGEFVAVANTSNRLITSLDGIAWTAHASGTNQPLKGVRFLNNQIFIAVGDKGTIRLGVDGTDWRPLTITPDVSVGGMAYGNGHYVGVGSYLRDPATPSSALNMVVTSTDGLQYALGMPSQLIATTNRFNDVAFGNGLFAAVGENANIQTSADGTNWVNAFSHTAKTLNGIAYGGGRFVAIGTAGFFVQSTDGVAWTENSAGSDTYRGLTYANGQFVAVGESGAIGTSTNGTAWTARTSGVNKWLNSVAYGNGTYVAVGFEGTVLRSGDGISWATAPSFTNRSLTHITFGNGQFVAVSSFGTIYTSPDGTTWTARTANVSNNLQGITHGNGLFVAVGDEATITTSPDDAVIPPPVDPGSFAISGVTLVSCETITPTKRLLNFAPQYTGLNAQPVSFQVVNEMVPTTSVGPYSLGMYVDNPSITLKATQAGTAGEATFVYNWLAACNGVVPPPANPGSFAITGVTLVSCQTVTPTKRQLVFTPQYSGLNAQPVSFQVINEMVPTTSAGPYSLGMYIDNSSITLKATQAGTAGETTFVYNWLAACIASNARIGAGDSPERSLVVRVLGNPVENGQVSVEVRSAGGQSLRMTLTDLNGREVDSHQVEQAEAVEQHRFDVGHRSAGLYLLRVSSPSQTQTVKVLRQ